MSQAPIAADLSADEALSTAPKRRWAISRADLMGGLYLVAVLNGVAAEHGRAQVGDTVFGVDGVVLVACAIGLHLSRRGRGDAPTRWDALFALFTAATILLPHRSAGWVAAGVLGAYGTVAHRRDLPLAAASAVFLAVSIHEVWGRMLLAVLTPTLARVDAALASGVLGLFRDGVSRTGTVIDTGSGYTLVIIAACVSFKAFLQGLLCCFAFTRAVRSAWRWSELATWGVLAVCMVALNTVRLALSGLHLDIHRALHAGIGSTAFGLVVLVLALGVAAHGVRHELGYGRPRR
jgi:hypothetical protein